MCKYNIDEFCVNADCPYVADYCPCYEEDSIVSLGKKIAKRQVLNMKNLLTRKIVEY